MCMNSVFFFFSSRRRHTRCLSDWSSDVCSSDLEWFFPLSMKNHSLNMLRRTGEPALRRSEERRVGKSVDLGGRRSLKKKKKEIANPPRADDAQTKETNARVKTT